MQAIPMPPRISRSDTPVTPVHELATQLEEAERDLLEALVALKAIGSRCQRLLTTFAELRACIASSQTGEPLACGCDFSDIGAIRGLEPAPASRGAIAGTACGHGSEAGSIDRLTPREIEVLILIASGQSNAAIARALGLSLRTVERHINNLYRKIDAENKADATAYALRHHLA